MKKAFSLPCTPQIRLLFVLNYLLLFTPMSGMGQCDCPQLKREDGTTITQCNPLPVSGDNSTQIGLSVSTNGDAGFVGLTIRFAKSALKLAAGSRLNIVLNDGNSIGLTLVNQTPLYIGNSQVTQGIFNLTDSQSLKLMKSNIKTIGFVTSSGIQRIYQAKHNADVLKNGLNCIVNGL